MSYDEQRISDLIDGGLLQQKEEHIKKNKMEIAAIIGAVSLAVCLAGAIALLIMGEGTPKFIKIFTWISMIPLTICFSILSRYVRESTECKVKYKKVNVELYEKVK